MSICLNHILSQESIQIPYKPQGLEIAFQTEEKYISIHKRDLEKQQCDKQNQNLDWKLHS